MSGRYQLRYELRNLHFKRPSGTSRGVLLEKPSYILSLTDTAKGITGLGECSLIPGLSPDPVEKLEGKLEEMIKTTGNSADLPEFDFSGLPALRFAWETALLDVKHGGRRIIYDNAFTRGEGGISINGLIWMNQPDDMWRQVQEKVAQGFHCIKLKVGALDFNQELALLEKIRLEYGQSIELRVDANGAFKPEEAFRKLERLAKYTIHSIEQPIKAGQWDTMAQLCAFTPIPIALDEELIGIENTETQVSLLKTIKPQYIILKPSLIGGLQAADTWISLAEERGIGWWATSALEANIGLNAIAQWAASKNTEMPQGLGTGALFTDNIPMPLEIRGEQLWRLQE